MLSADSLFLALVGRDGGFILIDAPLASGGLIEPRELARERLGRDAFGEVPLLSPRARWKAGDARTGFRPTPAVALRAAHSEAAPERTPVLRLRPIRPARSLNPKRARCSGCWPAVGLVGDDGALEVGELERKLRFLRPRRASSNVNCDEPGLVNRSKCLNAKSSRRYLPSERSIMSH